jgi:hypothetical protein
MSEADVIKIVLIQDASTPKADVRFWFYTNYDNVHFTKLTDKELSRAIKALEAVIRDLQKEGLARRKRQRIIREQIEKMLDELNKSNDE